MARMSIPMDSSVLIRDQFKSFLLSKKAYGAADKTLATYEQHFSAISKHLDVNKPIDFLCKKDMQKVESHPVSPQAKKQAGAFNAPACRHLIIFLSLLRPLVCQS